MNHYNKVIFNYALFDDSLRIIIISWTNSQSYYFGLIPTHTKYDVFKIVYISVLIYIYMTVDRLINRHNRFVLYNYFCVELLYRRSVFFDKMIYSYAQFGLIHNRLQ